MKIIDNVSRAFNIIFFLIFVFLAPPSPQFPDSYSTIIEGNIVEQNITVTAQEYFDHENNRATLKMRQRGTLHDLVFDYDNDQLFYVVGKYLYICIYTWKKKV